MAIICDKCGSSYEIGDYPFCRGGHRRYSQTKTAVFPFITPHITDHPIEVSDLGHVRRLEKQYGVVLSAFNNEPNNPSAIKDPPRYRPGGREAE